VILTLFLSSLIGLSLGLLGGGGTVLTVPILMYAAGLGPKEAIAASLLVVALASIVGALQQRAHLDLRTGALFGAAGMAGAYGGGRLAGFVPEQIILALFALMMLVTAIAMLRSSSRPEPEPRRGKRPIPRILIEGAVVGLVTGLVGAGGGFLVVPALALMGGLPMKSAVATSLFVISLKSLAGFAGYLSHVDIDLAVALPVAGTAMIGAIAGGALAKRTSPRRLKKAFALMTAAVALVMIAQQIPPSIHHAVFVERWPWWIGGLGVAGSALALLYFRNQILGVSTGCAELAKPKSLLKSRPSWRIPFIGGIVLGGMTASLLGGGPAPSLAMGGGRALLFLAGGILLGFGARTAGGCTSGHAIAGVAQGARASIIATAAFLAGGFVTTQVMNLLAPVMGGPS
jgi:uncharacterized membrane protein YfcA